VRPRLTLAALGLAAAGCLQVDVFQPVRTDVYAFPGSHVPRAQVEEVALRSGDGVALAAVWAWQADRPGSPTALYLHGQAENVDGAWGRVQVLWDAGYNVLALDYRGFGRSAGTPSEAGLGLDARAALDALVAEPDVDPARVVLWGFSLGTGVAAAVAPTAPVAGLVLEAPFTSMQDMVEWSSPFGIPGEWITDVRFDTLSRIGGVTAPLVIAMGRQDSRVPNWMSRRVFDRATAPKRLVVVAGAEHEEVGPKGIGAEVAALRSLSPGSAPGP
jgi:alpha-beta hydrolase superfamily lysophospholipase